MRLLLSVLFEMPVPNEDLNGILELDAIFCRMLVTFMKPTLLDFVRP